MYKCLRISFDAGSNNDGVANAIQKNAKTFDLEGIVQVIGAERRVTIIACGMKDNLDAFLDAVYKGFEDDPLKEVEVEPFLKDKDYRGVFRIIE